MPKEISIDYYLLDRKLKEASDDTVERHIAMRSVDGSGDPRGRTIQRAIPTRIDCARSRRPTERRREDARYGRRRNRLRRAARRRQLALGAASGLVSVNWTAAQEAGVVSYALDRKLEGAASYDLNVEIGYPQGDGTTYSLFDDPHGTGTFIYRLRATLSNGTDRILAEGGVTL